MAYSSSQKEIIRKLRLQGCSLNEIVLKTKIPKSTFRSWIKDISLTPEQKNKLKVQSFLALQAGRIRTQQEFVRSRIERESELMEAGIKEVGSLSHRELFIAGVALYWAEGFKNKHEKRLGFCNSDPKMIGVYLEWLSSCLGISKSSITARLSMNIEHKDREEEILLFWQRVTGLPSASFTKTFYQKVSSKKQYATRTSYYGVLRLHVKESLNELLKMKGWIEGLSHVS